MTEFNNKHLYRLSLISLLLIRIVSASVCQVFPAWCAEQGCNEVLSKPGVIFGSSGTTNVAWTTTKVDMAANTIEVALRGKLCHNPDNRELAADIFNSNGDGTYTFNARQVPVTESPQITLGTGEWSVEWSINTDVGCGATGCKTLRQYTYLYEQDIDPTYKTKFVPVLGVGDIINKPNPGANGMVLWDHALGTTNGKDATTIANKADYLAAIGRNTVAQNSWKAIWTAPSMSYNPQQIGLYDFRLSVFDGWTKLATVQIQIIVRNMDYGPFPPDTAGECLQNSFMPWIFDGNFYCLNWVNTLGTCQALRSL